MELQEIEVKIRQAIEDDVVIAKPKRISVFLDNHIYAVLRQNKFKTEVFRVDEEGKFIGIEEPPGPNDSVIDLTQMFGSSFNAKDIDEMRQELNELSASCAYNGGVPIKSQPVVEIDDYGTQEYYPDDCLIDDRKMKTTP